MAAAYTLRDLLSRCRAAGGVDPPTHTAFDGGSYYLAAFQHDGFYREYHAALARGEAVGIVERPRHVGPVRIDLDMRAAAPGAGEEPRGQLYDAQQVADFVREVYAALERIVDLRAVAERAVADCFVLAKPARAAKDGRVKDGLHVVLPHVVTRPEVQLYLRKALLPVTAEIFGELGDPEEVYDEAVIERNGWLMLGSRKMEGGKWEAHAWTIARAFRYDAASRAVHEWSREQLDALVPPGAPPPAAVVRLLSIRNKHVEAPLTERGARVVLPIVERREQERLAARAAAEAAEAAAAEGGSGDMAAGACDDDALAQLVALLAPARAVAYETWYKVGQCLANVTDKSEHGLRLFHAFSKRADEAREDGAPFCSSGGADAPGAKVYDAAGCDATWQALKRRAPGQARLGVGSMCLWAEADSPEGAAAWKAAHRPERPGAPAARASEAQAAGDALPPDVALRLAHRLLGELVQHGGGEGGGGEEGGEAGAVVTDTAIDPDAKVLVLQVRRPNEECAMELRLAVDSLHAKLVQGDRVVAERFIDQQEGSALPVPPEPDLAALSAFSRRSLPTGRKWFVSRPGSSTALFHTRGEEPCASAEMLNINTCPILKMRMADAALGVGTSQDVRVAQAAYGSAVFDWLRGLGLGTIISLGSNNSIVVNIDAARGGGGKAGEAGGGRRADYQFLKPLQDAQYGDMVAPVCDSVFWWFDASDGLWRKGTFQNAAGVMRELVATNKVRGLQPAELQYLQSDQGPVHVVRAIQHKLQQTHRGFAALLDKRPRGCVPFANGMYDAATKALRPFRREDYVSETLGYEYAPPPPESRRLLDATLAQIFPDAAERAYVLAMVADAMFGSGKRKHFLVLTDDMEGDNGKTVFARMVEATFGALVVPMKRDTLEVQANANTNAASPLLLAAKNKRLALLDELSQTAKIDFGLIKDLSSGASVQRGRPMYNGDVVEFEWTALILIACNMNNFPTLDSSDQAFLKRMRLLKMRSSFVPRKAYDAMVAAGELQENTYAQVDDILETLKQSCKGALVDALAEAYVASLAAPPPEPPVVGEMRDEISLLTDLRLELVSKWLEESVDFDPQRGPGDRGKHYYAYLKGTDVCDRAMKWWRADQQRVHGKVSRVTMGALISRAMLMRGRKYFSMKPTVNGRQLPALMGYNTVRWKADEPAAALANALAAAQAAGLPGDDC